MPLFHAVLRIDHHNAELLQFDATEVQAQALKAHSHPTKQRASTVRTEHEFFAEVCDALAGITEVLVAGSQTGLADFKHYVEKHRPAVGKQIVAYETVDHLSENQLVAMARSFFLKHDRMAGIPTPT